MDTIILAKKIIQITRHGYYEEQIEKISLLLNSITSASNEVKHFFSDSLPLVSREELISLLEDKRILKMSNLPADIYYLSRKDTADYLMSKYVITKR